MWSPSAYGGASGSWFRIIANSWELRDWSNKSTANCWHWRRKSKYSDLHSCSANAKLRNSHDNLNAVNKGSAELSAIKDGLANARYSFTRLNENRNESSVDFRIQSSQPHLNSGRQFSFYLTILEWLSMSWIDEPDVMRSWNGCTTIQQNFQYFIIVFMSG